MTKKYLLVRFIDSQNPSRTYYNARWTTHTLGNDSFLKITFKDKEGKILTDYVKTSEILSIRTFQVPVETTEKPVDKEVESQGFDEPTDEEIEESEV